MRRTLFVLTLALSSMGLLAPLAWATEEAAETVPDADVATVWTVLVIAAFLMAAWVLLPVFRRIPKAGHHDEEH